VDASKRTSPAKSRFVTLPIGVWYHAGEIDAPVYPLSCLAAGPVHLTSGGVEGFAVRAISRLGCKGRVKFFVAGRHAQSVA